MTQPEEKEAIRTTIVGGRPPGCGKDVGDVPRGIELLVKKAAVDAEFRALLLEKRAGAAEEIDLTLTAGEKLMLQAAPSEQLEAIIANTSVAPQHRRALMGKAAAVMLVAFSASLTGCGPGPTETTLGSRPDEPGVWNSGPQVDPKSDTPAQVDPAEDTSAQSPVPRVIVIAGLTTDDSRDDGRPE